MQIFDDETQRIIDLDAYEHNQKFCSIQSILKTNVRKVSSINEIFIDSNSPAFLCQFSENNWTFDYYAYIKGEKNLYIHFSQAQGVVSKNFRTIPKLEHWQFAPYLNGFDSFYISDPTIRLPEATFGGGWFQGVKNDWVFLKVLNHIVALQQKFNYEKIIVGGTSQGGFATLQTGIILPSLLKKLYSSPPPPPASFSFSRKRSNIVITVSPF